MIIDPAAGEGPLERAHSSVPTKRISLTQAILAALVLGVVTGGALHAITPDLAPKIAKYFDLATALFLRLIKMVIAPLVLATLITGIANLKQGAGIGRIFGRTFGWFLCASLISLGLGLVMVNLLQPGAGVALPSDTTTGLAARAPFELTTFVTHLVPTSIVDAMARNEVLQIVVFSLFAGAGLAAIGGVGRPLIEALDALVQLMLKITEYIMLAAPIAVFGAIASVVAVNGLGILATFARFIGGFYLSLALLWAILLGVGVAILGYPALRRLILEIREPFLLTFATASSEASYPKLLAAMDRFGSRPRVASFVLPLGYSFNLDGSMMYCAFASLFIAQAYGIDLSVPAQLAMLLLLMVTSKGIAGVPRASLVVVAATLPYFDIPAVGLVLIVGVDHFLDMGRSATNVIGNALAIAVIDKFEPKEPD